MSDAPSSAEEFTDQFFNELQVVLSLLDIVSEKENIQPEVMQSILTARAHAQAMVAPARWLLQQYKGSLGREKTLECALNMALDIGRREEK